MPTTLQTAQLECQRRQLHLGTATLLIDNCAVCGVSFLMRAEQRCGRHAAVLLQAVVGAALPGAYLCTAPAQVRTCSTTAHCSRNCSKRGWEDQRRRRVPQQQHPEQRRQQCERLACAQAVQLWQGWLLTQLCKAAIVKKMALVCISSVVY